LQAFSTLVEMLSNSPFIGFIPVRDASVARAFYEGELGLTIVNDTPFALVVDANGTQLRLTPVTDLAPQSFTIAGWQVADISAMVRSLSDRGVRFLRFNALEQDELGIWTTPSGDRVAWFNDPDGNTLSLTTFISQ
jgi:catechol 2,3-dioxygenase-like lactoylglutathione lyase family enzyme